MVIYYHKFVLQIEQFALNYYAMLDEETKKEFILKFANQLGKIKKEKNLSFRKIADNCDLDASFISKIEKGTENITLETILNLMYGLNVKPKELFDFDFDLKQDDIRN